MMAALSIVFVRHDGEIRRIETDRSPTAFPRIHATRRLERKVRLINHLLGEHIRAALVDSDVTEVYCNHDGVLRTSGTGGRKKLDVRLPRDTVNNILSVLADFVGRRLGGSVTSIAATLPSGERVHGHDTAVDPGAAEANLYPR